MKVDSPCLPGSLSPFLFLFGGIGFAGAIGWFAAKLNAAGWTPIGLLPLVVGAALGVGISRLASSLKITCPTRLMIGTVVFALVAIVSEHAWLYREFCRQWTEARIANPQVALFRSETPWSLAEYLGREATPTRAALWGMDAAIIVITAVIIVKVTRPKLPRTSQATPLIEIQSLNPKP